MWSVIFISLGRRIFLPILINFFDQRSGAVVKNILAYFVATRCIHCGFVVCGDAAV